jgi:hypothetical protein
MCPVCIATAVLIVKAMASAGGVTATVMHNSKSKLETRKENLKGSTLGR